MKLLFLVSRFPFPLEKGDKLRAYQHIMNLRNSGHEVHLVALSDVTVQKKHVEKLESLCSSLHVLQISFLQMVINLLFSFIRGLPLQVGYFYSTKHKKKIKFIINKVQPDLIYCQLIRTVEFVKDITHIPLAIDYQDAFSKGTQQRIVNAAWFLQPLFKREYKLVKAYEENSYSYFKAHFIISEQDRLTINISGDKKITILANGIDLDFFKPAPALNGVDITFVGNMNYPPNVDGARFLVKEIMPIVWKSKPNATVQLAGTNPNARVRALAAGMVTVTGWVDDIRDSYKNTNVFIAPMRIGTGLQNKLLEAMAMEIPCITTPLSFDPLGAEAGIDILVGENAQELAAQILKLLDDRSYRNKVATSGHRFVVKNYSMHHSAEILNSTLQKLIP